MTIEDNLNEELQKIQDQLNKAGLGKIKYDTAIEDILNADAAYLDKMALEDCEIGCYKLNQYALFLQIQVNYFARIVKWANHRINILYGQHGQSYGSTYTKYEERRLMLISGNDYGKKLADIINNAECNLQTLDFLANKVYTISQSLGNIRQRKYSEQFRNRQINA